MLKKPKVTWVTSKKWHHLLVIIDPLKSGFHPSSAGLERIVRLHMNTFQLGQQACASRL